MGPVALHGGGEFSTADRSFLGALLQAARPSADARARACGPGAPARVGPSSETSSGASAVRVALVTTAAARQRPELAARNGERAIGAAAEAAGLAVRIDHIPVIDEVSAASSELAGHLVGSDLVYLPGGDPGLVVAILAGSLAWDSILAAKAHGAVVAGASAGAMGFAEWTWTPGGGQPGLGLVRGLYVVPHDDGHRPGRLERDHSREIPPRLGRLGLAEATGVLGRPGGEWRVVGPGVVSWRAAGGPELQARDGDVIRLDA